MLASYVSKIFTQMNFQFNLWAVKSGKWPITLPAPPPPPPAAKKARKKKKTQLRTGLSSPPPTAWKAIAGWHNPRKKRKMKGWSLSQDVLKLIHNRDQNGCRIERKEGIEFPSSWWVLLLPCSTSHARPRRRRRGARQAGMGEENFAEIIWISKLTAIYRRIHSLPTLQYV